MKAIEHSARRLLTATCLAFAIAAGGCATVRPWEREHLAATPMQAEGAACERFDHNVEVYREGAVGGSGGKSGGGCGCT